VYRCGKYHPPYYGPEDEVIDIKEKNGEACKEREEGKMYHDPQALNHPYNDGKPAESFGKERTNQSLFVWTVP
jgi:hypothetical protein